MGTVFVVEGASVSAFRLITRANNLLPVSVVAAEPQRRCPCSLKFAKSTPMCDKVEHGWATLHTQAFTHRYTHTRARTHIHTLTHTHAHL